MIQSSAVWVVGQSTEAAISVSKDRRVEVGVLGSEESEDDEITEEAMVRGRSAMWNQLANEAA